LTPFRILETIALSAPLNDREILSGAGSRSHELAKANAEREFDTFNEIRRNLIDKSDFDDVLKNIENKKDK
jgi:hypothetical protein